MPQMIRDGLVAMAGEDVAALLDRCANGDQSALKRLYDTQSPRLYALALRLLSQPVLAADAVHDVFLRIWERSERFDPGHGDAAAWLTGLLRYRALSALRLRGRVAARPRIAETVDGEPVEWRVVFRKI